MSDVNRQDSFPLIAQYCTCKDTVRIAYVEEVDTSKKFCKNHKIEKDCWTKTIYLDEF